MSNFKFKVLTAVTLFAFFFLFLFAFLPSCPYKFGSKTYWGTTKDGTLIALSLSSKGGEVKGHGCHQFHSGFENHIVISGTIDCETGRIVFNERYMANDARYFGAISGMLTNENSNLIGGWTDSQGEDYTEINLVYTKKTPDEVLATESLPNIKKRGGDFIKKGKAWLAGIASEIF